MIEIWKDIPGYEGKYQASNLGNIKSLSREFITKRGLLYKVKGKIKKLTVGSHGYKVCNLGFKDLHTVHTLVAKSFLPLVDGKTHVDHINSIRTDNRVENLQWVTQSENNSKQKINFGTDHWNTNLSEKDIKHIRDERDRGITYQKIADGYLVSYTTIYDIVRKKTWKHV